MDNEEPKTQAQLITRPAYLAGGEIYRTAPTRWIGELYIKGKRIHTTSDYDCESAAYIALCKFIQGKYKKEIYIFEQ